MKRKTQSNAWIDPRLVRPADWSPPAPENVPGFLLSWDPATRETYIMGILSSLGGAVQSAYYCRLFYMDSLSPTLALGPSWSPWRYEQRNLQAIQSIAPHIEDGPTRALCQAWVEQMQSLQHLNADWKAALAAFFGLPVPPTEAAQSELQARVDAHRRERGPTWMQQPEFPPLLRRLEEVIAAMEGLAPRLQDVLRSYYSRVSPGDLQSMLGDSRAEDLLEASRGQPDDGQAIRQLNRALRYGQTGQQASDIYLELGFRYAEMEDLERAIESYTRSTEAAAEPNATACFCRGEVYLQQEQWARARQDFERALALGLDSPQREKAVQYLSELQSR